MDSEMQIALLGILGTLGGTILGWILNNLSQHGKLNIFISAWEDKFQFNNMGSMTLSSSIEQTQDYLYRVSFDLYNSSRETKIMRNIEIIFSNGKEELYRNIPKDESTKRMSSAFVCYDDILPINIPPKSIIHIELQNWISESDGSLKHIWNTTRVYLRYINEKNRKKKVLIKKEKYKDYFMNNPIKES
ncbi:MAG: hypothetical protein HDR15_02895 [Lachnospiraceae bacterium]|nr:hypothetical protein [Lachnospiraceae bacterium]